MTLACDALDDKVKTLTEENNELKIIINRLETKILENNIKYYANKQRTTST